MVAPPTDPRAGLTSARTTLDQSRSTLIDKIAQGTAADIAQAQANVDTAETALAKAISDWLGGLDPTGDIARLETTAPIVFFPVRIETRFEGQTLKIRIYPDEIFLNRHETALTQAESDAGEAYYVAKSQSANGAVEPQASWRDMVRQFGSQRAAYILRTLTPTFAAASTTPIFPTVQLRPTTLTRPAEAVLPDRWLVMTRRGNTRTFTPLLPIPEPLAMTGDPMASDAQISQLPNGYNVQDRTRWTIDFDRAVQKGMAASIGLSADDAKLGFDRVVVFGVKTSLSAVATSAALEKLIDAHHYTRGVALVQQGSTTNNTQNRPTAVPPADDAGSQSFTIERSPNFLQDFVVPLPTQTGAGATLPNGHDLFTNDDVARPPVDGYFWTRLLGVPSGVAQNIERAYEFENLRAVAMNRLLWPLTYGAFLRFLMDPVFTDDAIDKAKAYCIRNVFARGPAPAFRIGQVPYGMLPVASLARWQPITFDLGDTNANANDTSDRAFEAAVLNPVTTETASTLHPLRRLVSLWKSAASGVSRVQAQSQTPDTDLIGVLALFASSRNVGVRYGLGPQLLFDTLNILGWDIGLILPAFDQATSDAFQLMVGHPEWRPRIGRTMFRSHSHRETLPFVDQDQNLSETAGLAKDYLFGLAQASTSDLIANPASLKPATDSLLYELLRISTLTALAIEVNKHLDANPVVTVNIGFPDVWGLGGLPIQTQSIISALTSNATFANNQTADIFARSTGDVSQHLGSLRKLSGTPTAELDRLARETLDLASHRLDAWVTAFATRRVSAMRSVQEKPAQLGGRLNPPVGTFFGGYAWVEDLRPLARTTMTGPDGTQVEVDPTNGGFIHAPGSRHAMAAAVMRSGFLTFSKEDPQKYAFDLSSRQVRTALQVLDEVRSGRHVGEVLGYRFERGLQDDHPGISGLNVARFAFRKLFPLVAGKNGVDVSQPADTVAAQNVVDGLALYRAFKAGTIQFTGDLPQPGTMAYNAIQTELQNLGQILDGVSDLLVGEGVFQLAGANVSGALPSLDNLVRGGQPPNPEIAKSPRAGRALNHRVAYVFQGAPPALPPNWPATPTSRATAEPVLNAWLGSILGDPTNVTASVHLGDGTTRTITLAQLGLHPLDVVALARAVLQPNQAGLIDMRVIVAATGDDTTQTVVSIDYTPAAGRDPTVNRTFPEVLELARTLGDALGASRPLALEDLLTPADADSGNAQASGPALANAAELRARATAAINAMKAQSDAVTNAPDPVTLRNALRQAAQIAPERAFVPSGLAGQALTDAANALVKEFARRQALITNLSQPPANATSDVVLAFAQAELKAVFGSDMFVMPQVTAPSPTQLAQSLGAQQALLAKLGGGGVDTLAILRFLQQASHARPRLAKVRKLALYTQTLGAPAPGAIVAQLPFVSGERWLALPFDTEPTESRLSLVLITTAQLVAGQVWTGVVLDSWTEVIPSKTQPTSIAFNYNGPRAEATQAVLVMAPSNATTGFWQMQDIVATLEETLDLAKVRAVDRDLLGTIGQVVPGIVLPTSSDGSIATSTGVLGSLATLDPSFSQGFS